VAVGRTQSLWSYGGGTGERGRGRDLLWGTLGDRAGGAWGCFFLLSDMNTDMAVRWSTWSCLQKWDALHPKRDGCRLSSWDEVSPRKSSSYLCSPHQPINQSTHQPTKQSTNQTINQPNNQLIKQSINQPTNQPINQSFNLHLYGTFHRGLCNPKLPKKCPASLQLNVLSMKMKMKVSVLSSPSCIWRPGGRVTLLDINININDFLLFFFSHEAEKMSELYSSKFKTSEFKSSARAPPRSHSFSTRWAGSPRSASHGDYCDYSLSRSGFHGDGEW